MPYGWVDPDPIVTFPDGKQVFYAYRDDRIDDVVRDYHFCLNIDDSDETAVDIRDWDGYDPDLDLEKNVAAAYAEGALHWDEDLGWMCARWAEDEDGEE